MNTIRQGKLVSLLAKSETKSAGSGTSGIHRARYANTDLRWGPDGKGFRRLLHPNGVCPAGHWQITEETDYTGYSGKAARRC